VCAEAFDIGIINDKQKPMRVLGQQKRAAGAVKGMIAAYDGFHSLEDRPEEITK
jgi:hypothetical protein